MQGRKSREDPVQRARGRGRQPHEDLAWRGWNGRGKASQVPPGNPDLPSCVSQLGTVPRPHSLPQAQLGQIRNLTLCLTAVSKSLLLDREGIFEEKMELFSQYLRGGAQGCI